MVALPPSSPLANEVRAVAAAAGGSAWLATHAHPAALDAMRAAAASAAADPYGVFAEPHGGGEGRLGGEIEALPRVGDGGPTPPGVGEWGDAAGGGGGWGDAPPRGPNVDGGTYGSGWGEATGGEAGGEVGGDSPGGGLLDEWGRPTRRPPRLP